MLLVLKEIFYFVKESALTSSTTIKNTHSKKENTIDDK